MQLKIITIFLVSLFFCGLAEKARFDNYRVYELNIYSKEQLDLLLELENYSDAVSHMSRHMLLL